MLGSQCCQSCRLVASWLGTYRAKGTEFAKVLLFDVSAGSIPMRVRDYDFDDTEYTDVLLRERSLLYVAASRARDELVVTYAGRPSELMPGKG